MPRVVVLLFDSLLVLLFTAAVGIAATGGGALVAFGRRISARAPDNLLLALVVLLAVRYALGTSAPAFGRSDWSFEALGRGLLKAWERLNGWTEHVDPRQARRILWTAIACVVVLKAALAWTGIGFFSGDDVEVQEMSLRTLWHTDWPVWNLRNALFPLGIVYPAHWLAFSAGLHSTGTLVWAGRVPVVFLSSISIWLVWRVLRRQHSHEAGWALIGAVAYGTSHLHVAFGSSELPRPVSTVLVLGGFALLQTASLRGVCIAAGLVGLAASLRFSESVFVVPAVAQLLIARRWMQATVFLIVALAVGATALAIADVFYWGNPFHSVLASIDYTLVRRLSSRGYQSAIWYLTHVPQWVTPSVFVLAVIGTLRGWSAEALWAWLPVLLLSALPHKEARYLIPAMPFVYLLAIRGVRRILSETSAPSHLHRYEWLPFTLAAAIALGVVYDIGHWRLPRTNADVELARRIAHDLEPERPVVAEQAWRLGGHLYFGSRRLTDLGPDTLTEGVLVGELGADPWVVIDSRRSDYEQLRGTLAAHRYVERHYPGASTYRVWRGDR